MWRDPHEQEVTAAVSLDAPWALVQRFNGLVRDSGSKAERRGVEYIIKQLAKAGVPHALHEPELLISLPRRARLEVVAPEPRVLTAKTPSMSLSTDGRYKRGNLVYVPTGQAGAITAIFARVELAADVAGRVVLTEGYPSPGKVAALQDRGAQAAVFISPGERIHEGICTTIWGSPDLDSIGRKPTIPVLAVNKAEGAWLRALAEAGAVKVRYATKLDEGWRPIRVLVQDRQHLRRSVRIAWWSGHSHGRYAGSTWFADTFATDIDENCILPINCDSPGCRWATVFEDVFWMSEAEEVARAVIHDTTGQDSSGGRPLRAGDKSFSNIGVSTFYMLSSTMPKEQLNEKNYYPVGGCGGNIAWHTEDDTLEIADRDHLLRDIKVYAAAAWRAANRPLYTLNFAAVAAEFERTLRGCQEAAGSGFSLGETIEDAQALGQDLARFYDRTAALTGAAVDDPRVRRANEVQRRLARILVPVNYTRAGRFRHDAAVDVPPLPDLEPAAKLASLDPGSEAYRLTLIHLTRGRNRVRGALRAARQVLADAGG